MAVDPNDLLIFKMRGMQFGPAKKQPTISGPKIPKAPIPSEEEEELSEKAFGARVTEEAEEAIAPELAAEREALGLGYLDEENRKLRGFIAKEEQRAQEAETRRKTGGAKSAKEEIEAAKGLNCVNHPWRPAYAVCDYCGRPYCYADLVMHEGKYYDLEDIENVSKQTVTTVTREGNTFQKYAGVVFLVNAVLLAYFVYPQWPLLANYVAKVGVATLLTNLGTAYGASLFNIIVIVLGALAGASLFGRSGRGFLLSTFSGSVIIILISYEFLSSNATYLLAVMVLAFISIVVLAFSRMSATSEKATFEEIKPATTEVQWPQIETF